MVILQLTPKVRGIGPSVEMLADGELNNPGFISFRLSPSNQEIVALSISIASFPVEGSDGKVGESF